MSNLFSSHDKPHAGKLGRAGRWSSGGTLGCLHYPACLSLISPQFSGQWKDISSPAAHDLERPCPLSRLMWLAAAFGCLCRASHRFRMFQAQNNESTTLWSADGRVYVHCSWCYEYWLSSVNYCLRAGHLKAGKKVVSWLILNSPYQLQPFD